MKYLYYLLLVVVGIGLTTISINNAYSELLSTATSDCDQGDDGCNIEK